MGQEERAISQVKKALIVDDEHDLAEILAFQLEDAGFEVVVSHSGSEAWILLRNYQFDVVISDMRMPDGDGEELLKLIAGAKEKFPPVIILSGYADFSDTEAKSMGAAALLKKPMDLPKLVPTIERILSA